MMGLAALLIAATLSGDAAAELRRIAEAHAALRKFDLAIEVRFLGGTDLRTLNASVQKIDADHEFRCFGHLSVLSTPEWNIVVDAREHVIVVGKGKQQESAKAESVTPADVLTRLTSANVSVAKGELGREGQHWLLESREQRSLHADLVVDPQSRLIRELVYEVRDGSRPVTRVEIAYSWRDPANMKQETFDPSHYISVDGDTIKAAVTYSGYRIIRGDAAR